MTETESALRTIYLLRENIYAHLAKAFYGFFAPEEFDEAIQFLADYVALLGEPGKALISPVARYCEAAEHTFSENTDHLEFEYNRLFVGPAQLIAAPYESVYTTEDYLVMGETMLDVRRAYREIGLEFRNVLKEPEDHIATELEYLVELQARCLTASQEQDSREVGRIIRLEQDFLEDHILSWVPKFCRRIIEGSQMEFFCALADVLSHLVRIDHELLRGLESIANHNGEETDHPFPSHMKKEDKYGRS